jgi:hypothetical protein
MCRSTSEETIMTEYFYKGRSIQLIPILKDNGTWICRYLIIEKGHITSGSIVGCPEITFSTRKDAQSAALKAATDVIDAR